MEQAYIGTSGYSYAYWKNRFYPKGLPASKWLQHYGREFNTVELNYTFYRFPATESLIKSALQVPDDFRFSVKAHKLITHTLRMKNAKEKIAAFTTIVQDGLQEKLACILYQLPPSYSFSEDRLKDILNNVLGHAGSVIEFRHASWWNNMVYETFRQQGLIFCSASYPGLPEDNICTGAKFYKRMHGIPELFASSYPEDTLQELSNYIHTCDQEAFVYFNNTMYEAGYSNARLLNAMLAS